MAPTFINGIDTIEREVEIVDTHLHGSEHWFGAAAVPDGELHVADADSMTPFVADGGNDTWGDWLQVLGSTDTPVAAGKVKFDLHRVRLSTVQRANTETRVQIASGATGDGALAAGVVTEFTFRVPANARSTPVEVQDMRIDSGTKVWVRVWADGEDGATVAFFHGLHEYEF